MEYNFLIARRLLIGDQNVAHNKKLLKEELGVTHIVACGVSEGKWENDDEAFSYFCVNEADVPTANLLRHMPRATSFIASALRQKDSVVLIHCTHGQSRSCAIAVAYLLHVVLRQKDCTHSSEAASNKLLLHECYDQVQKARPSMAINPGFVRQLEILRRMWSSGTVFNVPTTTHKSSRAHASFRAFRAHTEFHECRRAVSKWGATTTLSSEKCVRCISCRTILCAETSLVDSNMSLADQNNLPQSDYWTSSPGGRDFYSNGNHQHDHVQELKVVKNQLVVEPIQWMMNSMMTMAAGNSNRQSDETYIFMAQRGKLACPNCHAKIGSWDWKDSQHDCFSDFIFLSPSKVELI